MELIGYSIRYWEKKTGLDWIRLDIVRGKAPNISDINSCNKLQTWN